MSDLHAAIDLGSNSFHLLLARRRSDGFETVERLKEKVQLLGGFAAGRLHPAAMARGEACLARFSQRLAAVPRQNLRMVGTHALREADNRAEFAAVAERLVGVPLEVVSGHDEARLIYHGVAHHVPCQPGAPRLVIDVGGGSTELAWSTPEATPGEADRVASFKVGCVSLTDRCFGAGANQEQAYRAAYGHALEMLDALEPVAADCTVIGTSGTIESVQTVLAANGWGSEVVSAAGLAALADAIVSRRWLVEAGLPGLPPDRVDIFPAGVALVEALFARLGIQWLRYVDASLQDGLLYRDVPPPEPTVDLRDSAVARLKRRYRVDDAQAARVRTTALALFDGCAGWWEEPARYRALLGWAAELHQIGMAVAPRHYHRHGAYLLQNSDLRAFSRVEQDCLALLVRGHRRSFPGLAFRAYEGSTRRQLERLLALLRIAVILQRSHSEGDVPEVRVHAQHDGLDLELPAGWLAQHSLSARELEVEAGQLASAGIRLRYR
jgi:exopolyphosphatase/guanosine-5'-triphosphate,3'-diphosphate pyrophosphatase